MIKINVRKQSNYPVSSVSLKKRLKKFFADHGIVSDAEVSVALVGEKKMLEISSKFLKDKKPHNVLSFVPSEDKTEFVYPLDGVIHLGEIIICYPLAFNQAKKEGKLIDEKVYELAEHGGMHLLGKHHN